MKKQVNGKLVDMTEDEINSRPTPSVNAQIATLERQVTPRHLRGAALGDEYAINHIRSIEDQISALRSQLNV